MESTPRDIHPVRTGAETVTRGQYRAERGVASTWWGDAIGTSNPQHGNANPGGHRSEVLVSELRDPRSGESPPGGFPDSGVEPGGAAHR